jgi:hypothetical protein
MVLERFASVLSTCNRFSNLSIASIAAIVMRFARAQVGRTLDLTPTAKPALETLSSQLNEAYLRVAANLATNPDVRVEQMKGKDRLSLTGLKNWTSRPAH